MAVCGFYLENRIYPIWYLSIRRSMEQIPLLFTRVRSIVNRPKVLINLCADLIDELHNVHQTCALRGRHIAYPRGIVRRLSEKLIPYRSSAHYIIRLRSGKAPIGMTNIIDSICIIQTCAADKSVRVRISCQ